MGFAEDIDAVVAAGDIRLACRDGRWQLDSMPDSPDWGWRERAQRQAGARMLEMRANDLPPIGYHPDRPLAQAEQVRDALGAVIIYVRPAAEPDAEELSDDVVY